MIGDNIKKIRESKGLGVNELSRLSEVNASYISALERNEKTNPSIQILNKIAVALEVSVDEFFKDALEMDDDDKKNFFSHIKGMSENAPEDIDLDLDFLKLTYEDIKINEPSREAQQYYYRDQVEFANPEEAIQFILKQPTLMAYGGYNLKEMTNEEILDLANDLLLTLKISLERRKKK